MDGLGRDTNVSRTQYHPNLVGTSYRGFATGPRLVSGERSACGVISPFLFLPKNRLLGSGEPSLRLSDDQYLGEREVGKHPKRRVAGEPRPGTGRAGQTAEETCELAWGGQRGVLFGGEGRQKLPLVIAGAARGRALQGEWWQVVAAIAVAARIG